MSVLRSIETKYTITADTATATDYRGRTFQVTEAWHYAFISDSGSYQRVVTLLGQAGGNTAANTTLTGDGSWLPWLPQPSPAWFDLVDEMVAAARVGAK